MDKQKLAQYRDLKKEIAHLEARIKKLSRPVRDRVRASNHHFPYQEIHIQIEGEDSGPYKRQLERILQKRKAECAKMTLEVESFIASIPDSRTRMIFERRYICGWSWQKISISMGSVDESFARKIHDRSYKKIDTY